ncbi:MAG: ABC transporter permease [Bacteroidetes bacterium]|nr:ABC transporter permease [Bacteroidota bacterium]
MSNNHPIQRVMKREFEIISGKWTLIMLTFIGPLLAFWLIMLIFSSNVPHDLPVALVDQDNTSLSRLISRMTDATPIAAVDRSYTNLYDAQNALEKGKVDAILFLPEHTEKEILSGRSSTIVLYLNNANVVKSGLMNSGIRKALSTLSAGIKLKKQLQSGKTQKQAMAAIMPVQLHSVVLFNPYISYSYFLTLGLMPVILIVFTLLGTTYAIGNELLRGTGPQWINAADGNIIYALCGKIFPYTIFFTIIAVFMNIMLFHNLGLPLNGKLYIILFSEFLLIVSYQFMSIFLLGLFSNLRLCLSLGSAYSMLALTYSGLTFPVTDMPAFGQAFAGIFPFTYWLKIFISQSLRGEPSINSVIPIFSLFVFILLGSLFIPRLKFLMLNKKYWGKY